MNEVITSLVLSGGGNSFTGVRPPCSEAQAQRLTRAGWEEFLNAIERSEEVGFAYEQGGLTPVNELPPPDSTKEVMTSGVKR